MAGFFGNYDKAGPGVSRNEVRSNGPIRYFAVFFRKFWSLALVNLFYFINLIPVALACLGLVNLALSLGYGDNGVILMLCFFPVIFLAPGNAGITKITRDFAREEPCFVWQDFIESARKNFKQSLAVSIFAYLGTLVFIMAFTFYYGMMNNDSFLSKFPFAITLVLCVLFVSMVIYLQLMVVTLDLKIGKIFKNAVILAVACLGKNIIAVLAIAVYCGLYAFIFYLSLGLQAAIIILIAVTVMVIFALISYTANYIAFPQVSKFVIEPFYRNNPDKTAEGILSGSGSDEADDGEERELPEYVYENGRMIHRSVIESRSVFDDKGREDGEK